MAASLPEVMWITAIIGWDSLRSYDGRACRKVRYCSLLPLPSLSAIQCAQLMATLVIIFPIFHYYTILHQSQSSPYFTIKWDLLFIWMLLKKLVHLIEGFWLIYGSFKSLIFNFESLDDPDYMNHELQYGFLYFLCH